MIVVTVTLVSANTGKSTQLGEMHIINDGFSNTPKKGSYDTFVMRKPDFKSVTRQGVVSDWPRLSKTVWHLVARALKNMGYVT